MATEIFKQYEIPNIPPASEGIGSGSEQTVASQADINTPYQEQTDATRLASRVESLEKYVQDLMTNAARVNSNVDFKNLNVKERLNASFGKIGGFDINAGKLESSRIEIDSNNEQIKSKNYNPGVSGFKISPDLVEAENIKARGQLKGVTFSVDDVSAIGGQLMVSNADNLEVGMTSKDNCKLQTKGSSSFAVGDILLIQEASSGVTAEWLRVLSKDGNIYTVDRDLAGLYNIDENPTWQAGVPVVKQGSWSADTGNKYTAPVLTGGTNVSDLSVFQTLGDGNNDGKIKLTINDTVYDDLAVDLSHTTTTPLDLSALTPNQGHGSTYSGMPFTSGADWDFIIAITCKLFNQGASGVKTFYLYLADTNSPYKPVGSPLGSGSVSINNNVSSNQRIEFTSPIKISRNTKYVFVIENNGVLFVVGSNNGGGVILRGIESSDNISWSQWTDNNNYYYSNFKIEAYQDYDIVSKLKTSIQAATSSTQTVTYDADHFVITGVTPDYSISITSPSTGTDISGAGVTKYLDLNYHSTQGGYGSGGWLRLIGEGTNSPYYSVSKRLSGLYNDYQEVCRLGNLNGFLGYTDNEYGIAIGDTDGYLKYDPTNGLVITDPKSFSVFGSSNLRFSNNTETSIISATSPTKTKEIDYKDSSGTITIKFDLQNVDANQFAYGRIYKNGVAVGTQQQRNSADMSYGTYTETLSFSTNDLIQLYVWAQSGYRARAKNLRLYYDKQPQIVTSVNNL